MSVEVISIVIPAIAGLGGVMLGAWLSWWQEKKRRKLSFIEKQIRDFYSPLLGIYGEINMLNQLRLKIHDTARKTLKEGEECKKIIEYDNLQLKEKIIPAYHKMVDLFRKNIWLAEPETKAYFEPLLEYVEMWNRYLAGSLPQDIIQNLKYGEDLRDFYDHLRNKHDELCEKLKRGDV